jgi:hypothetical protein
VNEVAGSRNVDRVISGRLPGILCTRASSVPTIDLRCRYHAVFAIVVGEIEVRVVVGVVVGSSAVKPQNPSPYPQSHLAHLSDSLLSRAPPRSSPAWCPLQNRSTHSELQRSMIDSCRPYRLLGTPCGRNDPVQGGSRNVADVTSGGGGISNRSGTERRWTVSPTRSPRLRPTLPALPFSSWSRHGASESLGVELIDDIHCWMPIILPSPVLWSARRIPGYVTTRFKYTATFF